MQKYNNRNEVPEEYKWDLTPFFKNDDDYNEVYDKTTKLVNELKGYVGCTKDANKLYEYLSSQIEAIALWEDLYVYAYLINDQELGVSESLIRKNKAETLEALLLGNTSFFAPELLKLDRNEYEQLFINNPKLEEFRSDLDKTYREKEHILSESEEKIVSELVNAMNHYDDMSSNLINSQHDYGKVKLDNGEVVTIAVNNYRSLMRNKNVNIRKKVYNSFNKKLAQYSDSNAMYLNSYVSMNETIAKIRKYKDSWNSKLFGLNMSDKVFKTLVKTTEDNLGSLHKYYELKKEQLGIEEYYNEDLTGRSGYITYEKDRNGYKIANGREYIEEAIDGDDIYLTLDNNIQLFTENAVDKMMMDSQAEWGMMVVADAKTGAIKAYSTSPSYNPNKKNLTNYIDLKKKNKKEKRNKKIKNKIKKKIKNKNKLIKVGINLKYLT